MVLLDINQKMHPYYHNFSGKIKRLSNNQYESYGCYMVEKDDLIITELPVGSSTGKYKENLEKWIEKEMNKKNKNKVNFTSYTDNNTDKKVHFVSQSIL